MSNFPGSVDAFATKVDHVTPVLADDVNKLQDAVVAIESELKTPTAGLGYAVDAAVLHLAGAEAATGNKTFLGSIIEGKDFRRSAQSISETVLVSGVDATAGELVDVTLTANRVVGLPLNPAVGQELVLLVTMGGTGGYKLTYPAGIKTAWQPASAVGDISALRLRYFGTNWQQIGGQVAVSQLGVLAHRGPAVVGSLTVRDPNLSGPYTNTLPGTVSTPTPAGVSTGKLWDFGGEVYHAGTFGAKFDGATDDTAALTLLCNAFNATNGRYVLPVGTAVVSSSLPKLTNVFSELVGEGLDATVLKYTGSGICLQFQQVPFANKPASPLPQETGPTIAGFTIDGNGAAAGAIGFQYGDVIGGVIDIGVQHFKGAGSIGVLFSNATNFTERTRANLKVADCTTNVSFTVTGSGDGSFEHWRLRLFMSVNDAQTGLSLNQNSLLSHPDLYIVGNISGTTSVWITANDTSKVVDGRVTLLCDDAKTGVPVFLNVASGATWNTSGVMIPGAVGSMPVIGLIQGTSYGISYGSDLGQASISGGADLGQYVKLITTRGSTAWTLASGMTAAGVTDALGKSDATEFTTVDATSNATIVLNAYSTFSPIWVEFDLLTGSVNPITNLQVTLEDITGTAFYLQRILPVGALTGWQRFRFLTYVFSSVNNKRIRLIPYTGAVVTGNFKIGRVSVYHAREPIPYGAQFYSNPSDKVVFLSDAATVATDASKGRYFVLLTSSSRTMGVPTNAIDGMQRTYEIVNQSGGAITTTWSNASGGFKLAGAWVDPATGSHRRKITFTYRAGDPAWVEDSRLAADI